ncbi:MAG: enoyl-CoA hydratase-related protein [Acidimicrobiia bacterium]
MAEVLLRGTVDSGVATVTIDHPPTNLVDGAFIGALVGLLDECDRDDNVRVVVFTSADPDFFLMHGDVGAILAAPPPGPRARVGEPNVAAATFDRLQKARYVTIAAIDGAARGGRGVLLRGRPSLRHAAHGARPARSAHGHPAGRRRHGTAAAPPRPEPRARSDPHRA